MAISGKFIEKNIKPHNLNNLDEKGFLMGVSWQEHVIVFQQSDLNCNGQPHRGSASVPQGEFCLSQLHPQMAGPIMSLV